ncbi:MAG TPA: ABC transporter permease [Ignavibacteriaceae bacterium]|nr:ABC transporter permease [Ignavibacteriaceae bacterium]
MIKNYMRIAFRNLFKHRGFSLINIIGLTVGLTICLLILLFIKDELSYDKYNDKSDQIYRVILHGRISDSDFNLAVSCAPIGPTLVNELPEVENFVRILKGGIPVLRYQDKVFSEDRFFWADSTFFDVFSLPLVEGNPKTALVKPQSVVITESMAKKYFGNDDAVGKILNMDNRIDYMVTGVMKDVPKNSHFHFDFLGSLASYQGIMQDNSWLSNNQFTYVLLKKGVTYDDIKNKMEDIVLKYVGPQVKLALGVTFDQLKKSGAMYRYSLQPLSDIHLRSHLDNEIEPNSDIQYVYIFALIALGILLIACINFMNLATARSAMRAKEVGIRKTLGSTKPQLIMQFIFESILMSFIAVILAVFLAELFLPMFNSITGKNIAFGLAENITFIPVFILFAIVVGFIAGSYPAFFLSAFDPVTVLKGNKLKGGKNSWLRSTLVISQFAVSIILIIGTFIIKDQLSYIQNKKLGFNKDQIILVKKTDDIGTQIETFKKELKDSPSIVSVSNSTTYPGFNNFGNSAYTAGGESGDKSQLIMQMAADYNFVDTYQIPMSEGRYYSKEHPSDTLNAIVVNDETVRIFGLKDPIGKKLIAIGNNPKNSRTYTIIGVTKDFNYESLHSKIRPLAIHLIVPGRGFGRYTAVRFATNDVKNTLNFISKKWHKLAGAQEFEYSFFDQEFANLYKSEQRTSELFTSFSILALIIASMGLFGLVAFITERRTKEIGIRKVMGASIKEIVFLLSKEFSKWVLLANIIAWPVAYYFMSNWLKEFAYRIEIPILLFPVAGLLVLMVSLLTVSTLTYKAARANPANSLKYE